MKSQDVKKTWLEKLQDEAESLRLAYRNLEDGKTELEEHLEILKDFSSRVVKQPTLAEETNKELQKAQDDLTEIKTEEQNTKKRLMFVEHLENYIRTERLIVRP